MGRWIPDGQDASVRLGPSVAGRDARRHRARPPSAWVGANTKGRPVARTALVAHYGDLCRGDLSDPCRTIVGALVVGLLDRRDDNFNAAVLLAPVGGQVGRDRGILAPADGIDPAGGNACVDEH